MTFRDQLEKLKACYNSLKWVGDKTIEQAWETCEDSQWMLWILTQTDLDLIDFICDIAEGVLYLVPEESQLACIWAISAARRRANQDELDAAYIAAYIAAYAASAAYAANSAANSAASAATYAYAYAACHPCPDRRYAASNCTSSAANATACTYAGTNASCATACYMKEKKKQCDILRKYFTIDQVREALNKLIT